MVELEEQEGNKPVDLGETEGSKPEEIQTEMEANLPADELDENPLPEISEEVHEDQDDHDDHENQEETAIAEAEVVQLDYDSLSIEELMSQAAAALSLSPKESLKKLQLIRPVLDERFKQERKEALKAYTDAGNLAETFEYVDNIHKEQFYAMFRQAQDSRADERKRIEEEKEKNLIRKRQLLAELKTITEKDESKESVEQVKKIQSEWKSIRAVPSEKVQELWDSYHYYLNKFYDNVSINIELKELDRRKNLEYKIDLCKKVEELHEEENLKRCFILISKYQDEFRNTGPVQKEFNEEIWNRFKSAVDGVYASKKALMDELEEKLNDNLKLKRMLVEKASLIANVPYDQIKIWNQKTEELNKLFEEWKTIGPVPKAENESIWKEFRGHFNDFFKHKSVFFEDINKQRKANLLMKENLCKEAEALQESEDFVKTTKEMLRLQEEWKKTGPVPEKLSNAIWKRFRTACDRFFERKQQVFGEKRKQEEESLQEKEGLINRLNALLETEDKENAEKELKEVHQLWMNTGFVPFNKKQEINQKYDTALQAVRKKFEIRREKLQEGSAKEHYQTMLNTPNGNSRLKQEEFKIRERIKFLKGEIDTWQNNMEFFAKSKNADKLRQEIQAKIDKSLGQMDRLNKELKEIKSLSTEKV